MRVATVVRHLESFGAGVMSGRGWKESFSVISYQLSVISYQCHPDFVYDRTLMTLIVMIHADLFDRIER